MKVVDGEVTNITTTTTTAAALELEDEQQETNENQGLIITTMVQNIKNDKNDEEKNNVANNNPLPPPTTTPTPTTTRIMIYIYMILFFVAMIGHEVALEAASTSYGHLDSLACAVTCFQFTFCVLFPLGMSTVNLSAAKKGQKGHDVSVSTLVQEIPKTWSTLLPYVRLSLLVFGATGLATQAVRYVTYPTKVVFKSAKLIPTMMVASVWHPTKRYSRLEYLAAFLLCCGAAGYSYGSGQQQSTSSSSTSTSSSSYWGIILLLASIICDAIVPNYQKRLLNSGISTPQLMINVNIVGMVCVLTYMLLTNQLFTILRECSQHPILLAYLTCVGIGLSTAVWSYTKLIEATSSVVAVAVSTLRKVVTICLSYLLFPKPLLSIHIFSGILVLTGILISNHANSNANNKNNKNDNNNKTTAAGNKT